MEIDVDKVLRDLRELNGQFACRQLEEFSRLTSLKAVQMDRIVDVLGKLVEDPLYTEEIAVRFRNILFIIVTHEFGRSSAADDDGRQNGNANSVERYQRRCIALSKLIVYCPNVQKYSLNFFRHNPAPFSGDKAAINYTPRTKVRKEHKDPVTELELIECCYRLLSSNPGFFRNAWNWSEFFEQFNAGQCPRRKFYHNRILATITCMTQSELNRLNVDIPPPIMVELTTAKWAPFENAPEGSESGQKLHWQYTSDVVTNVGDVLLPIYERSNFEFYKKRTPEMCDLVSVDSTKLNLRSLALGVCSGRAVCLAGPVGSGKTSLVEYLAKVTGRVTPKVNELTENGTSKECLKKRKLNGQDTGDALDKALQCDMANAKRSNAKNGFLRIQLGDQTDSKMLLGQYCCTDTPGEFVWQPGVLTQAVIHGSWLLLEDLDSATQDVCTVLTSLLENDYLSVPGFRDCLRITPGFQLFVTLRTNKSSNLLLHSTYTLLEKHLYTVNILPLSRSELCEVICVKYPKLRTVASRIVDIYLTFSSGGHSIENDDIREAIGALQSAATTNGDTPGAQSTEDTLPRFQYDNISLSSMPSSSRLVSTRDLIKLCKRSDPSFSVTSMECAYFVFQNAVDIFCSHLPHGDNRLNLIISIGGKIGIQKSRCMHLSEEYKPDVDVAISTEIKVGRVTVHRSALYDDPSGQNDEYAPKRLKLDKNASSRVKMQLYSVQSNAPTFSFTRPASCLLERIAVSVTQNEPILLVGETGVGKTSSVQFLAYQTRHKLVVVNMNNQSDVSDLIGGFKPVDLSYVITPLRYEFEHLFQQTFSAQKNEKFLSNVATCYNKADYVVLVKLMLMIVDKVWEKQKEDKSLTMELVYEKWQVLQEKLQKLHAQLNKARNVAFAFIPGSLVNCIRNGDWVLLDEINLASTETLECLSTILEPDGSIILLEKGDLVPIKRHPDFRIFACMNPNTDVGKKDLPVGIRNRFTEFFVDELTAENDLLILVNDYLGASGVPKTLIMNTVRLYRKLRSAAVVQLNDGLGNKPVYSLRTLCRSLNICAKNLCGAVIRNLYEGFCISFLTQLDLHSHEIVHGCIRQTLLNDQQGIMTHAIPQPKTGVQLNFEGYWIEKGAKEVQECENYILTESVRNNLRDIVRIISIGRLPILLQGPTSAGKTSLIEYIAKRSGNVCLRINNHEHTDLQEYIGTYVADATGKLSFKEGVLVKAMRHGHWIILDELNLAPSDILEALNRVLDDNRELFIPETQVVVKAHPNFMLFATQNPPGLYGGRKMLSRAFKNRFVELHFSEIPNAELEIILEKRCLIPQSYAQKMVKVMATLQKNRRNTTKQNFTLRDLFRWGNRYTYASKALLTDTSYDWNQHLIDEGYLVLSSKVRNVYETQHICEALFSHFRKRVTEENLFSLHKLTSKVTKSILEQLHTQTLYGGIVWTVDIQRMAVLAAKALEFNEPVLLVGPTGCGKTTICQILAAINGKNLRILNCHMHTEGADFIGGLRPFRESDSETTKQATETQQLFEWSDGPLVLSMAEGSFFLADEISLAEDSVLERLNCVLEPERTLLLAEKGGIDADSSEFVTTAQEGFQFFATMNPGGDFGKKELSPALRNRLTEIWCRATDSEADLVRIAEHALRGGITGEQQQDKVAKIIIKVVLALKSKVEKLNFSIRDVLAWVNFLVKNQTHLSMTESLIYGLETVFLDALEMLPYETFAEVVALRREIRKTLQTQIRTVLHVTINAEDFKHLTRSPVETVERGFGIKPFYIDRNLSGSARNTEFIFSAPTTRKNLFRLLSALSLDKAILLEGPPGVGKTSLVENLACMTGHTVVRINLCEHTDLADLFGTDLPADDKSLELTESDRPAKDSPMLGSFVWRDGPLLAALKAKNTWILLDELNLAPQSVLEGLNAILDHRGEVYIAELNKTFKLGSQTRIFGAQNPLRQGGGRKGLPQSFLNRFTKVYLRKLEQRDLLYVVKGKYLHRFLEIERELLAELVVPAGVPETSYFDWPKKGLLAGVHFDIAEKMVAFSDRLEHGIVSLEFGYKGGPFEANLRDILRWCELFCSPRTGYFQKTFEMPEETYKHLMAVLFDKMKLVYYQRMRSDMDKQYILGAFSAVFGCDAYELEQFSQDVSVYWTDDKLYLGDIVIDKGAQLDVVNMAPLKAKTDVPILLSSQMELLKNLTECVQMEKPVILCGPTDCGKTKLINLLATVSNQLCNADTIDDSVTGSFQQFDFNRHLEDVASAVESSVLKCMKDLALNTCTIRGSSLQLMQLWEKFTQLNDDDAVFLTHNVKSSEMVAFRKRVLALQTVCTALTQQPGMETVSKRKLETIFGILAALLRMSKQMKTLNTGNHFEWVDSKIVKSLKAGQHICLEHVNLCSSAILDRLNPVFEPNGALLISEKGVIDATGQAEVVRKHPNFQAFLTLDPKNGEISRAMRNRCIELALHCEVYSDDDLRKLIYEAGIGAVYLIDTILEIHQGLKKVSEFSQFGIAHAISFAYLVAQNRHMGLPESRCLLVSALEVYVRSSNVDLLGYGLDFYRNTLKSVVTGKIDAMQRRTSYVEYGNLLVKSNALTNIALIRLQAEPLLSLLRAAVNGADTSKVLADISFRFVNADMQLPVDIVKYLLYFLYQASSFNDAKCRYFYLKTALENKLQPEKRESANDDKPFKVVVDVEVDSEDLNSSWKRAPEKFTEVRERSSVRTEKQEKAPEIRNFDESDAKQLLPELNKSLYDIIDKSKCQTNSSLPWDHTMFPRIRDYTEGSSKAHYNRSALLLLNTLLHHLTLNQTVGGVSKLSELNLLSYSRAVSEKVINDSIGNGLLTMLFKFLIQYRSTIHKAITRTTLSGDSYVKVILSHLWGNRLINLSYERLLRGKEINTKLLDKLTLHFKWIEKHCLRLFAIDRLPEFQQLVQNVRLSLQELNHPLANERKRYSKTFLQHLPLYATHQIQHHLKLSQLDAGLRLIPPLGQLLQYEDFSRRIYLQNHPKTTDLKRLLVVNTVAPQMILPEDQQILHNGDPVVSKIQALVQQLKQQPFADSTEQYEHVIASIDAFYKAIEGLEIPDMFSKKFETECLPLMEYFVLKSLIPIRVGRTGYRHMNMDFIMNTSSLDVGTLGMLKLAQQPRHQQIVAIYEELANLIQTARDVNEWVVTLPTGLYKGISAYHSQYTAIMHNLELRSLALNNFICYRNDSELEYGYHHEESGNLSLHGPVLTNNCLSVLLSKGGALRAAGLGELPEWRGALNKVQQLLWNNSWILSTSDHQFELLSMESSIRDAKKLLVETSVLFPESYSVEDRFIEEFTKLLKMFEKAVHENDASNCLQRNAVWRKTSTINTMIGAVQLNLIVYLPLLDPVERNLLKKTYTEEDIEVLKTLVQTYDIMAITMNYQRLGEHNKALFTEKISALNAKRDQLCQKVALRPAEDLYTDLVRDINNFLISCCHPTAIVGLLESVQQCLDYEIDNKNLANNTAYTKTYLMKSNEAIKQIELWVTIANKFEHHTMKRYEPYYQEFQLPVKHSIATMRYGLAGLRHALVIKQNSIVQKPNGAYYDLAKQDALANIMASFIQFPSAKSLDLFDEQQQINIYSIVDKIENSEGNFFRLVKARLQEINNMITIESKLSQDSFIELDKIVNVCNQFWQKQENAKRKRQAEQDSLYQTKSHCEEEDEETITQREIGSLFPSYVDEDFADFIQNDTLEQVFNVEKSAHKQKIVETICNDDYTLLCETFAYLMAKFSRSHYYRPKLTADELLPVDYILPYETKTGIFQLVLNKFGSSLSSTLDEVAYPGLSLLVGLAKDRYDGLDQHQIPKHQTYNFYKDANIPEIVQCVDVLKKVEERVHGLLREWPDHAVLQDIIQIIRRIYSLPSTAPIVRFNTGLQLLRQKIDEWNSVAHRLNNLRELERDIVECIHRWMRMELQYWRECMSQAYENVRSRAYRYWFFIYNLLHEYLQHDSTSKLASLLDYRLVEKRFGEEELLDEDTQPPPATKVSIQDVVKVLKQYMESSSYAEYSTRLRIMKSFEQYLGYLRLVDERKRNALIAALYNLHMYFDQFSLEIEEYVKNKRTPIEKKLKEFVKIESFNKDLSYFSMRNNIARVHRQLHKFLKEFETEIRVRVAPVFSPKDPGTELHDADEQKIKVLRSEAKFTYYMVNPKNFMASAKLVDRFSAKNVASDVDSQHSELLKQVNRFFTTARNVCRETITNAPYSELLYNLDMFMHEQIESVEYLRGLEVDRTQTKPKQKSKAKHILNQKRKALSDFYKSLTMLGLNFKTGLLEAAICADPVDTTIEPFSLDLLKQDNKRRKIPQVDYLNDKLDLYYAKCVFKFKMLAKVMLLPNTDVGTVNIERIKGFAMELFLLVQNQRKRLGQHVGSVYALRESIDKLTELHACVEAKNEELRFAKLRERLELVKGSAANARLVLEQFKLLLKCAPQQCKDELQLYEGDTHYYHESMTFAAILKLCRVTLEQAIDLTDESSQLEEFYPSTASVEKLEAKLGTIRSMVVTMREQFKLENTSEYSVYASSLNDLLQALDDRKPSTTVPASQPTIDESSVNTELENIIHAILIAMQSTYKKHSAPADEPSDAVQEEQFEEASDARFKLEPQHLKQKVNRELLSDIDTLNVAKVICKIDFLLKQLEHLPTEMCAMMIEKLTRLVPIMEQYSLLAEYYLIQQLGAHKICTKLLSVMLTVFIELGTKGFCVPKDLLDDDEAASGEQQEGNQAGDKFGFEDGEGEKDASKKIESEDQLEDAKLPGQERDKEKEEEPDNKEEKGIDMSEDFESKLQDIEKPEGSDSEDEKQEEDEDIDKQMGETEEGAEKLDDQIWGDDEQEEEENNDEDMGEEDGKGSNDLDDKHNNLDSEKDKKSGEEEDKDKLDAIDKGTDDRKKEKQKDIEDMNNEEGEEEQENPYHNELEEPPQPEDMDLDEDFKLDNDGGKDKQDEQNEQQENPFDIDAMKENAEPEVDAAENETEETEESKQDADKEADSSEDEEDENQNATEKLDDDRPEPEDGANEEDEAQQVPEQPQDESSEVKEDPKEAEEKKATQDDAHHESKDKRSNEDRIEAMPDHEDKGTSDQVANEKPEGKQEHELDDQDTGEDKDGVGQAENEKSDTGHQGIAESKETRARKDRNEHQQKKEKRQQGNTDEDRSLGDPEDASKKRLKTVDQMNRENRPEKEDAEAEKEEDCEEYQHVKDAKKSDNTTLDNATEEQSKKLQHQENKDNELVQDDEEGAEELMEVDEEQNKENLAQTDKELESEKNENKKDKPARKDDGHGEKVETVEQVEIDGEIVETSYAARSSDTVAHAIFEIINDMTLPDEPTVSETLEMRRMVEQELQSNQTVLPAHEDFDQWQQISSKMQSNARELCEQLRLILEPTKCTRLKGDYRTGRRINMKKIIPYIASQFRKDKIWLRRTKAAQRDYKITIAVDNSKSMDHNNSRELTLQAISLVSQALTLLESGRLNVLSFGDAPKFLLKHSDQFDGAKLISALNFEQKNTNIAQLLDFVRISNAEDMSGSDNGIFENLLLILSDGRNIYGEGEKKVKNAVKLARLQRIFIVYIIIDNPENKHSIMDVQVPLFSQERNSIVIQSYLDVFPFPYYVIVRDLGQLPLVLSDAMRQWFELVNSEQ